MQEEKRKIQSPEQLKFDSMIKELKAEGKFDDAKEKINERQKQKISAKKASAKFFKKMKAERKRKIQAGHIASGYYKKKKFVTVNGEAR